MWILTSRAGLSLDRIAATRAGHNDTDAVIEQLGYAQLKNYEVVKVPSPLSWRLMTSDNSETEAVFRMQGILCAFDLPPVSRHQDLRNRRLFIRQTVRLTGLSAGEFSKAALACRDVHDKFSRYLPNLSPWQPVVYEGHVAMDFNSRYFTLRKNAPSEQNLPFAEGVDPDGILASLRKHDLVHGQDNRVLYLRLSMDGRYVDAPPNIYQVGDIVEVSVCFVAVAVSGDKYIVVPQLRALILLDTNLRKTAKPVFQLRNCKVAGQLKRKRLYTTEDTDHEARDKLAKMSIDQDKDSVNEVE